MASRSKSVFISANLLLLLMQIATWFPFSILCFNIENVKEYGILHTLKNLTEWSSKEEGMVLVLASRRKALQIEHSLLNSFIVDYKRTREILEYDIHNSLNSKSKLGALTVGSSAILSHLMTWRYATITSSVRKLLQSPTYRISRRKYPIYKIIPII